MSYNQDPSLLNRIGQIESQMPSFPMTVVTPSTVGNIIPVQHGLGRVPLGWSVVYKSGPCDVYDAGLQWTDQYMYLKATTAGVLLQLRIY